MTLKVVSKTRKKFDCILEVAFYPLIYLLFMGLGLLALLLSHGSVLFSGQFTG